MFIGFSGIQSIEDRIFVTLKAFDIIRSRVGMENIRFIWLLRNKIDVQKARDILLRAHEVSDIIKQNIEICLASTREQYLSMLSAMEIFTHVKRSAFYSIHENVYQAMAHEVPVIVSESGPMLELPAEVAMKVTPGKGESEALALTIETIINNDALRTKLVEASKNYIHTVCSPSAVLDDLNALMNYYFEHVKEKQNSLESQYFKSQSEHVSFILEKIDQELANQAIRDFNW
jgi:glycosyltransferase involved in cell wall biosynthesis